MANLHAHRAWSKSPGHTVHRKNVGKSTCYIGNSVEISRVERLRTTGGALFEAPEGRRSGPPMSNPEESPAIELNTGSLPAQTVTVVPRHEEEDAMESPCILELHKLDQVSKRPNARSIVARAVRTSRRHSAGLHA
jgi:hypothetical protein